MQDKNNPPHLNNTKFQIEIIIENIEFNSCMDSCTISVNSKTK